MCMMMKEGEEREHTFNVNKYYWFALGISNDIYPFVVACYSSFEIYLLKK